MKKIKIILFLMTLFLNIASFSQTTTIDGNIVVNNTSISSTSSINLGIYSTSNINLAAKVVMPIAQNDTYPGTIDIYYQKNANSPINTVSGGIGGTLLFFGGTIATRSFNIQLYSSQFDLTGGFIFVEYKSHSGAKFKSSNISIIRSLTGSPTINPPISLLPTQNVPYGGVPLLPSLPQKIYPDDIINWEQKIPSKYVKDRYENSIFIPSYYVDVTNQEQSLYSSTTYLIKHISKGVRLNYLNMEMEIKVNPYVSSNEYYNTINEIKDNQYINLGNPPAQINGYIKTTSGQITSGLGYYYQWQERFVYPISFTWERFNIELLTYGWKNILGATFENYTPPNANAVKQYRRLILKKPSDPTIAHSSNYITIYPVNEIDVNQNSTCCDQVYANSIIQPLSVSINTREVFTSEWQESLDGQLWSNIHNTKNLNTFQPTKENLTIAGLRGGSILVNKYFRRINYVIRDGITASYCFISKPVKITVNTTTRISNSKTVNNFNETIDNTIIAYPNPNNSIVTISGIENKTSLIVKIIDSNGKEVISKNIFKYNNEFQLDISYLKNGVYTLFVENGLDILKTRIIKN